MRRDVVKATGSAFAAELIALASAFSWTRGAELVTIYEAPLLREPPQYRHAFCRVCGSSLPVRLEGTPFVAPSRRRPRRHPGEPPVPTHLRGATGIVAHDHGRHAAVRGARPRRPEADGRAVTARAGPAGPPSTWRSSAPWNRRARRPTGSSSTRAPRPSSRARSGSSRRSRAFRRSVRRSADTSTADGRGRARPPWPGPASSTMQSRRRWRTAACRSSSWAPGSTHAPTG